MNMKYHNTREKMHSAMKEYNSMPRPCPEIRQTVQHGTDFSPEAKDQIRCNKSGISFKVAKAIFIGEAGVGKTSLVMRYTRDMFDTNYKATIGVDFEVEKYSILDVPFTFQMWDTAGSERFQCIASAYYRGANSVVICFDYSKISTLNESRKWLDQAIHENPTQQFLLFLVGLKRDLVNAAVAKQVESEAIKVAKELNAEFWPCSAGENYNVDEFFSRVACLTFNDILTREARIQTEKKSITPMVTKGPRKITLDQDFYDKTSDSSCALTRRCNS